MHENPPMIERRTGDTIFLEFSLLTDFSGLRHAIFTRKGGFSRGIYQSLNVSNSNGDQSQSVCANRRRIRGIMGEGELIFAKQIHGNRFCLIENEANRNETVRNEPPTADALITADPGKNLTIQVADCQAILIYDPVKRIVANIHSGWRGSIQNIAAETVGHLTRSMGCNPRDMVAAVGPSLGPCCAEFVHYTREIPKTLWGYRMSGDRFDFWRMTTDQLVDCGIPLHQVQLSGLCTRCRTDLFFSYRKEQVTGRFAAVIGLA